ncbi:MAG TPA: SDR family oxidoreductase [Acidobacteriaceae bacterium]|jgi:uncharacterized oxidoreductase|nr:SDR family oxidoreductase [Acidobacteriaceae bacterium]
MNLTGNTILMTGGGSGIGRALAEAFHRLGNQVIIAGRRQAALDAVTAANPGMQSAVVDLQNAESLHALAASVAARYPDLNVLINNAGVMLTEDLNDPSANFTAVESMVETNLIAPLRLTAALLPLLKKQPHATLMTVSSGLAFLPLAMTPTYCATKAAIHSWTESLRYQLQGSSVQVIELIPPYVQTELLGSHQSSDPRAMPLGEFIAEVMEILHTQPYAKEVCVKRVYPLRYAAEPGQAKYEEMFAGLNDGMRAATAPH